MDKILIIDDDSDLREVFSTILSNKYQIKEAESQKQGFEILKDYLPKLIILDVMMETESSGFEMCRQLKNDEKFKDIKILMITNIDNVKDFDFKSNAGDPDWLPIDKYLTKPVDPKTLLETVDKLIE